MRITDVWGSLEVEHGGALVRRDPFQATVTAVAAEPSGRVGDGWRLTLRPGWTVKAGARAGDRIVECEGNCAP